MTAPRPVPGPVARPMPESRSDSRTATRAARPGDETPFAQRAPRWHWRRRVGIICTPTARRVAAWLDSDDNPDQGYVDTAEYATKFGVSEKDILLAVVELQNLDLIGIRNNGYCLRHYRDAHRLSVAEYLETNNDRTTV